MGGNANRLSLPCPTQMADVWVQSRRGGRRRVKSWLYERRKHFRSLRGRGTVGLMLSTAVFVGRRTAFGMAETRLVLLGTASAVDFHSRRSEHVIPQTRGNFADDRRLLAPLPNTQGPGNRSTGDRPGCDAFAVKHRNGLGSDGIEFAIGNNVIDELYRVYLDSDPDGPALSPEQLLDVMP